MTSGSDQPMCTARPGWQSITLQQQHYKKRMYNIHIDMPDILEIDEENKFVRVEPMVNIGMYNFVHTGPNHVQVYCIQNIMKLK